MTTVQGELTKLSAGSGGTPANVTGTGAVATTQPQGAPDTATELKVSTQDIGKATSGSETTSQDQLAAPRINNELDTTVFRILPASRHEYLLANSGVTRTDFIYDLKPAGDAERFIPASIKIPTPVNVNNANVSVRPTRLNLDFLIPTESLGNVRFFLEGDLFSSEETTPRMRHAYAQVKDLNWPKFFQLHGPGLRPGSARFSRAERACLSATQFRYSVKVASKTNFSLSLEKPSSDIAFTTPEFSAVPNAHVSGRNVEGRREIDAAMCNYPLSSGVLRPFFPMGVATVWSDGVSTSRARKSRKEPLHSYISWPTATESSATSTIPQVWESTRR